MNNRFIPAIVKEKINYIARWFKGSIYLLLSTILFLSILTFDINDNSFLTSTSKVSSNALGDIGSYLASFVIYSFLFISLSGGEVGSSAAGAHAARKTGARARGTSASGHARRCVGGDGCASRRRAFQ